MTTFKETLETHNQAINEQERIDTMEKLLEMQIDIIDNLEIAIEKKMNEIHSDNDKDINQVLSLELSILQKKLHSVAALTDALNDELV